MDPRADDGEQPTPPSYDAGGRRRRHGSHRHGSHRHGSLRLILTLLAIPLVALLAADGLMMLAGSRSPTSTSPSHSASRFSVVDSARARVEARGRAIQRLLDERAAAIVRHDRAGFLKSVDPAQPPFVASQGRWFDNLAQVPFESWSYSFDPASEQTGSARLKQYGAPAYAPDRVGVHYRLSGFDAKPTDLTAMLTFVQRGSGWYVASTTDFDTAGNAPPRDLWDAGPVRVVHGASSLVLGHPASLSLMRTLAAEADAAVPRVTRIWGADWARRVVILVPSTQDELSSIVHNVGSLDQIAAVATAEVKNDTGRPDPVGDRVLVNPPNFAKLGPLGRRVVLTHEITHVATRPSSGDDVPEWLVEGFADYVGYSGTDVAVHVAARELRADVLAGRVPKDLPDDVDFAGSDPRLAQVYEESWLACRMLSERWGEPMLVSFYRRLGKATAGQDIALDSVMQDLLHTTPAQFDAAWVRYVRAQLS